MSHIKGNMAHFYIMFNYLKINLNQIIYIENTVLLYDNYLQTMEEKSVGGMKI